MKLELKKSEKRFGGVEVKIDGKLFDNVIALDVERHTITLSLRFDGADVTYEDAAEQRQDTQAK